MAKFDDQVGMEEINPEYQAFVEKFQPKKTTDDCYTPEPVFQAVAGWACEEYGIAPEQICRPFWPGEEYTRYDYPEGCVVLDNPPFSILSGICKFYNDHGMPFFLFAPSLTVTSLCTDRRNCAVVCAADVIYENGANVKTGFVTNMEPDCILRTAPELLEAIKQAQPSTKKELPKYKYPVNVISAALVQKWAAVPYRVRKNQGTFIRKIEANPGGIFGGGLLLTERAAAERAAAERAAAERAAEKKVIYWELSDEERALVRRMSEAEED